MRVAGAWLGGKEGAALLPADGLVVKAVCPSSAHAYAGATVANAAKASTTKSVHVRRILTVGSSTE